MFVVYRRRLGLREQLATYHFLSGMAGVLTSLLFAPALLAQASPDSRTEIRLFIYATIALFGAVMAVGVGLFSGSTRVFVGAVFLQLLQILVVNAPRLRWDFFAGAYVAPFWVFGKGFAGAMGLKAAVDVGWTPRPPFYVGLNLFPFVVLWFLYRCWQHEAPSNDSISAAEHMLNGNDKPPPAPSAAVGES